jgi:hypothetical protein
MAKPKTTKAELEVRVAQLERSLRAIKGRYITAYDSWQTRRLVALHLTRREHDAVIADLADMACSSFGDDPCITEWPDEGRMAGVYEGVYLDAHLLPQFAGFLVRYSYTREAGTHNHRAWGLVDVEANLAGLLDQPLPATADDDPDQALLF